MLENQSRALKIWMTA